MVLKSSVLRVARPTDKLNEITSMYVSGLGFQLLSSFKDHDGFDGSIIGHPNHAYHLEFTHHAGTMVGRAPTKDNLLVFFMPDHSAWIESCKKMEAAGFISVQSFNSYWDSVGKTFEDADGYRVVLQNAEWVE
ncbi:VOC family protein [Ketobacter alkanivorans]|uniref:Glyoxalase n=1 Tax=Ketobacter alkanivorans TaxID=1917421 RepID=A0A2K9LJD9_9GAMM|nr:VOC family protein [Ketobacter alkanivorans]AUM12476.1 glyoxalase [Ketobacter alkanivorans]